MIEIGKNINSDINFNINYNFYHDLNHDKIAHNIYLKNSNITHNYLFNKCCNNSYYFKQYEDSEYICQNCFYSCKCLGCINNTKNFYTLTFICKCKICIINKQNLLKNK